MLIQIRSFFFKYTNFNLFPFIILLAIFIIPDFSFAGTNNIQKSLEEYRKKNFSQALTLAGDNKILAKIIKVQQYIDTPVEGIEFHEIQNFISKNYDWPYIDIVRLKAESVVAKESPDVIRTWFKNYPPKSSSGYKSLALCINEFEDSKTREAKIQEIWKNANFSLEEQNEYAKKYSNYIDKVAYYKRLNHILWTQDYNKSQTLVAALMKNIPPKEKNPLIVRLALKQKDPNAIKLFYKLKRTEQMNSGLLYDQISFLGKKKINQYMAKLLANLPPDKEYAYKWAEWRILYARELFKTKQYQMAYKIISNHGMNVTSSHLCEAEWLSGWIMLRHLYNPVIAEKHFRKFAELANFSVSKAKARYWIARALHARSKIDDAKKHYIIASKYGQTFYGQLAAMHLGKKKISLPKVDSLNNDYNNDILDAAILLAQNNMHQIALLYAKTLIHRENEPVDIATIVRKLSKYGNVGFGVELAKIASTKGIIIEDIGYPRPYDEYKMYVEKPLVYSVIRQESSFNQNAFDPKANDSGLMQIIPSTARSISNSLGVNLDLKRLLTDPAYNIEFGSYHLLEWLEKYDGNYILAIASYNAGDSNVDNWIRNNGDPRKFKTIHSIIDWIELITFPGTRSHVQRILENLAVYRLILNDTTVQSIVQDLKRKQNVFKRK